MGSGSAIALVHQMLLASRLRSGGDSGRGLVLLPYCGRVRDCLVGGLGLLNGSWCLSSLSGGNLLGGSRRLLGDGLVFSDEGGVLLLVVLVADSLAGLAEDAGELVATAEVRLATGLLGSCGSVGLGDGLLCRSSLSGNRSGGCAVYNKRGRRYGLGLGLLRLDRAVNIGRALCANLAGNASEEALSLLLGRGWLGLCWYGLGNNRCCGLVHGRGLSLDGRLSTGGWLRDDRRLSRDDGVLWWDIGANFTLLLLVSGAADLLEE